LTHDAPGTKPKLLVLSHVLPFPRNAGQQQRVFHTLEAAREYFSVTFVAPVPAADRAAVEEELSTLCDEVVLLPSRYAGNPLAHVWHRTAGVVYAAATGLKRSNYAIGRVELTPTRVAEVFARGRFDCALFEYWHAAAACCVLQENGIPCVLDMHDILWRSYEEQLAARRRLPEAFRRWAVSRYRAREEEAWRRFDGVTAINKGEFEEVRQSGIPQTTRLFYAPMGVDLARWPYSWKPEHPPRMAFYGALNGSANQRAALRCLAGVMPSIWRKVPDAELWLVGSNPPAQLSDLVSDPRVHVTGFVEDVAPVLSKMTAVLCPWSGTFGFRSRLVEVMALGVPVVVTPDAVAGMEFENERGALIGADDEALARLALRLLDDAAFARAQSRLARKCAERFSMEDTYGRWMRGLSEWLGERKRRAS
jgi:Glycosyltransferase